MIVGGGILVYSVALFIDRCNKIEGERDENIFNHGDNRHRINRTDEQKRLAEESKKRLEEKRPFVGAIVTEITAATTIYSAEECHLLTGALAMAAFPFATAEVSAQLVSVATGIDRINKTEEEWREILSAAQYDVLRNEGTEPSFLPSHRIPLRPMRGGCARNSLKA